MKTLLLLLLGISMAGKPNREKISDDYVINSKPVKCGTQNTLTSEELQIKDY